MIQIDQARIRDHHCEMVRGTVEETLKAMLEAEVDRLCGADRYERSEARAGSYDRTLQTRGGEVSLRFQSCVGRPSRPRSSNGTVGGRARSRRRSSTCIWQAFLYVGSRTSPRPCVAPVSARAGSRTSTRKLLHEIATWRHRCIEGEHPYLYRDGIVMKRSWVGEVRKSRFSSPVPSIRKVSVRFWASARALVGVPARPGRPGAQRRATCQSLADFLLEAR